MSLRFRGPPYYERTTLGDCVDKASMRILKEDFEIARDRNVIASPLGILTLLAMISVGTEGQSKQEIMQLLGSTHCKQIENSYSQLTDTYTSMDPSYFTLANKMYVSDNYTLDEQFSKMATGSYKTDVERVNFGKTESTANVINKWAHEKTDGRINSLVNENMINDTTAVALFNVIFFQGHWNVPFEESATEEKDFYVNELITVKKPTMRLNKSLYYYEDPDIGARMVELPYKEDGFRMVVVLPDKKDGLKDVVDKLAQRGLLENVFKLCATGIGIMFEMPKFEIRNNLDLNRILPNVGVSRIFLEGAGGVVRERAVEVSMAFQQALVKVNEEGASAGAFTGVIWDLRSRSYKPRPLTQFKVDHPFLFAILHRDIVLFTGTYAH